MKEKNSTSHYFPFYLKDRKVNTTHTTPLNMEKITDTLFLVGIPFLLGYFFGKMQNQIDNILSRSLFQLAEKSEEEEESFFPTEEKLKRVEKWEKEIYDIHSSYEEKQVFSHPSQKYVCLGKFWGDAPVLMACDNRSDEIFKLERRIKDFFEEEIVDLTVETARDYVAEYGYHLIVHHKPMFLSDIPKLEEGSYLKNKTIIVSAAEKKNGSSTGRKQNENTENKKECYVKNIFNISYKVC